jgi:hypothetical protein
MFAITLILVLYCGCVLVLWCDLQRSRTKGLDMKKPDRKPGRKLGCFKRPRFGALVFTQYGNGWCEAGIKRPPAGDTYIIRWRPVCVGDVSRIVNRWFNRGLFTIGELEAFEEACLLLTEAVANEQCEGK